jgi:hypothetical protein
MHPEQKRYWYRIGINATVIFALGMTGIALVRWGVREAGAVARSADPLHIPLALLPFRVDGVDLGTMEGLELRRSAPDDVSSILLTVRVPDSGAARRFEHCLLAIPGRSFSKDAQFRCATPADTALEHLGRFGEVVLEPGGTVLPIVVPAGQVHDWRKLGGGIDSAVKSVRIQADSTGAVVDVRRADGRKLVHIEADKNGGARITVQRDSLAHDSAATPTR